jgi:NAD(P)-dependent dehydrogenase (short-subunit alcohol dehydrogenase family)
MNRRKPIESVTPEDFERVIGLNLRSAFFLSQAAQRRMREHGGGKIIHIGSMTSTLGLANLSVYGMSKSALAQVTKTMAVEWARDNIQVNCIAPGFMRTPLTEDYYWKDPHRSRWLLERIPARRGGEPEDLAGIVVWLASPASSYVTGQVIAVDGGFTAGGSWDKQEE